MPMTAQPIDLDALARDARVHPDFVRLLACDLLGRIERLELRVRRYEA